MELMKDINLKYRFLNFNSNILKLLVGCVIEYIEKRGLRQAAMEVLVYRCIVTVLTRKNEGDDKKFILLLDTSPGLCSGVICNLAVFWTAIGD